MKSKAIRLPLRSLLALFLVIVLAVGGMSTRLYAAEPVLQIIGEAAAIRGAQQFPSASDGGVFTLPVEVRFCQTEARSELDMINELRTGGNAWYWNSSNTEKIYVTGLSALQYDYDLEKVAMQRAAEIAVYYDHYRPDGNICFQTYNDFGYSYYTAGENIAAGYMSAADVFVGWAEEDEDYSGQGHRRNMLNSDFTAVGCACVYYEGIYYWVQNFGAPVHNTTKTAAADGNETRNVSVRNEFADQWALTNTELNVNANEPTDILDLLRVNYLLSIIGWGYAQGWLRSSMLKLDWQPKDTSIVTYKDGVLTGKSGGTTTMTALTPDGGTTLTVTVHVTGSASEHHWENIQYEWTEDLQEATASATCSHCSETLKETVRTTATVTTQATCTANGETTYTAVFLNPVFSEQKRSAEDIPALGHDIVADAAVAATCTASGLTAGEHCTRCDYQIAQTVIPALGHDLVIDAAAVAATCIEPGLTAGAHCRRCDYKVAQEVVPALGHDWDEGKVTLEPTETEKGEKTFTCLRCGATRTETIPNLSHVHSYTAVVTEPTCTEQGYTTHTCDCGDSYVDTFIAALGHDWDDGVVTTPATETAEGVKTFTCLRCGATRTETVPATGGKPCDGGPACPSFKFRDVKYGDWYHEAVDFAVTSGLFNGMSETTFEPNTPMSRAMLVTVLWRYEGEKKEGKNSFSDVPSGQWYTDAVAWAAANGIVGGVGNNRFDPNGNITREQMAAILYRYAQGKGFDVSKRGDLSGFPDRAKVSDWATDAIKWAVGEGIIGGSDGKLLPQGNATRAQVATILMRFIEGFAK